MRALGIVIFTVSLALPTSSCLAGLATTDQAVPPELPSPCITTEQTSDGGGSCGIEFCRSHDGCTVSGFETDYRALAFSSDGGVKRTRVTHAKLEGQIGCGERRVLCGRDLTCECTSSQK